MNHNKWHDVIRAWSMRLRWLYEEGAKRTADLKYKNDNHTAWCIEKKGKFVNYDIGGS